MGCGRLEHRCSHMQCKISDRIQLVMANALADFAVFIFWDTMKQILCCP